MSKAKPSPRALPKRFYQTAGHRALPQGYEITLDGKPLRTPAKKLLHVASLPLAQHIAAEWEAQQHVIDTDTMPLTRLASLALDRMADDRASLLKEIARYTETDLVLYRAEEAELQTRQATAFEPLLRWIEAEHDVYFATTVGIMPVAQDARAVDKIAAAFAAATDQEFAALAMLVPLLGSALVTLALWRKSLSLETVYNIVRLDENFQAERWGTDPHAAQEWEAKQRDIAACALFLRMHAPDETKTT